MELPDLPFQSGKRDVVTPEMVSKPLSLRFFDRRTGSRWPAAQVAEIRRGNLAEWMAPEAKT